MPPTIERTSPVPYYEQLFEILRAQIQAGEIAPDERLPSELELCRDYGLSRATGKDAAKMTVYASGLPSSCDNMIGGGSRVAKL